MPTLIAGTVAVIVLYLLLQMFRAANPAVLARALKTVGGVVLLAIAAFVGLRGELFVAIPLGIAGAGLLGYSPKSLEIFRRYFPNTGASPGRTSQVRSELLEMVLDHNTGQLAGRFVAGPYAGHSLDEFDLPQLAAMIPNLDAESVALFESYLDRRFPAWRENAQRNSAGGQRRATTGGKMTDEEAYQILGLKPGASRDEIGRAHRTLMKKLHPDQGGSTYLAARVNEAKDTLLRTHQD
jgi:DnaJ domain